MSRDALDISDLTNRSRRAGPTRFRVPPRLPVERPALRLLHARRHRRHRRFRVRDERRYRRRVDPAPGDSHPPPLRRATTTAASSCSGPTACSTWAPATAATGGDPRENAQDRRSLLGKLLRINPLDPPGARDYTIPAGNPYKGKKGKDEIYARGLRNPFRFTFDPNTGRIAIGDVGQERFEEVDYETPQSLRNANFGWDRWEGLRRYNDGDSAKTPKRKQHDKPIHVYGHGTDGGSCSITGGVVVRDELLTNLYGRYLYADFCAGQLRSFMPELSSAEGVVELDDTFDQPTSFAASPFTSRIYVTSLGGDVRVLGPQN